MLTHKMKLSLLAFVAGVVFLCIFVVFGPFISMLGIQSSLEAENEEALNCYIDFPVLQDNFKTKIREQAHESLGFSDSNGLLAQFAMKFTNQIIDVAVERAISPEGISLMISGKGLNEILYQDKNESAEDQDITTNTEIGFKSNISKLTESEFEYITHEKFVFYLPNDDSGQASGSLVFHRKGLFWKLSDVVFE